MSKSLDQVWRDMQQRRQAEIQRQMLLEKQEHEKRERSRQEYLAKMRMYEVTSVASSSAAAGAAGAGGGGRKKKLPITTSVSQQSVIYFSNDDGFKYFIYNFDADSLTDIKTIQLPVPSVYPVTRGGFLLSSYDGDVDNYQFLFLNLNGDVIWQDTSFNSSNYDIDLEAQDLDIFGMDKV